MFNTFTYNIECDYPIIESVAPDRKIDSVTLNPIIDSVALWIIRPWSEQLIIFSKNFIFKKFKSQKILIFLKMNFYLQILESLSEYSF